MAVILNATCFEWTNLIINVFVAIGTIAAVIVAVFANKKSNEQLMAALKIQEQSKNIDLFDRRIELIERISKHEEVSIRELKILFCSEERILEMYCQVNSFIGELQNAEYDKNKYIKHFQEPDGYGAFPNEVVDTIQELESKLAPPYYTKESEKKFKDFCDEKSFSDNDELSGEFKYYNYFEISERIARLTRIIDNKTDDLCKLMEEYVETSIKPLI